MSELKRFLFKALNDILSTKTLKFLLIRKSINNFHFMLNGRKVVNNFCQCCFAPCANLCILWAAVLAVHTLSCSVFGALWLRGGFSSATRLDEWTVLSLQLDVCGQAN